MSRFEEGRSRPTPESMAAAVLEGAPDAMVIVDASGTITLVNGQAEHMFGYARGEMLGRHVEILIPQRFRARHGAAMSSYVASPHIRQMGTGLQLFALRKDGAEIPVDIRLSPLRADGRLFVTAAIREVTSERRHHALEAWLAAIVESSDDAIIGKTLDGTITSWNGGAQRLFGYTEEEAVGRPITILVPEEAKDEEAQILDRIRRGERISHYETRRRRKDGQLIDVSLSVSPIRGPGRTPRPRR